MIQHPLFQLSLARLREFYREPEAVFWSFLFPILMVVGLGVAFRNRPIERVVVDIDDGPGAAAAAEALGDENRFITRVGDPASSRLRLRTGKTSLVVVPRDTGELSYEYVLDPTRPESLLARAAVDDSLQRAAGRLDPVKVSDVEVKESGARYIDFLVPGLLGMSLMGGGLWSIGFVTVDMRIRKLLKRFMATPMKKHEFLASLMLSRMAFMVPEVLLLLVFSRYAFGVINRGSVLDLVALIVLGSLMFSGIGLLVAARPRTLEAVSGLMNVIMLPMWLLSGIFFSSERFPPSVQPFIKLLPLTPLNDALRGVMLEGVPLLSQGLELGLILGYSVVCFALALWWFRWS